MDEVIKKEKPLAGLRVLEMGQLLAGPFAASMLAGFGAEVIKIERPVTGDPIRVWRKLYKGTSLWWLSLGRNKKSVTIDLTREEGQALARRIAAQVDIVLENFKPGTMEKWGTSYDELRAINPRVIMVRVSGWGQTGPYSTRPGYANVAEAIGGIRYTSGYPDRPPVRTGVSLGDTLAGLHAALGALMAVYHRTTRARWRSPTSSPRCRRASLRLMRRLADSAVVLSPPARRATSPPKRSSGCCTEWASPRVLTKQR